MNNCYISHDFKRFLLMFCLAHLRSGLRYSVSLRNLPTNKTILLRGLWLCGKSRSSQRLSESKKKIGGNHPFSDIIELKFEKKMPYILSWQGQLVIIISLRYFFSISLRWPIYLINSVDKSKLVSWVTLKGTRQLPRVAPRLNSRGFC